MNDPSSASGIEMVNGTASQIRLADIMLRRCAWVVLVLASVGLLASSIYRAATFPFTHDESLSFAIFNWDPRWWGTANNHLLNTFLMQCFSASFGNSELVLRLPNLLAHGIYLICVLLLLRRLEHPLLRIAGFVLLNLNPFLLDFFFLARGYGLALAFLILSLYLLTRAYEEKQQQGFPRYLYLAVAAGALAVLANFAFLNYYLPLLLASAWLLLSDASLRRFSRGHLSQAVALFSAGGFFLALVLYKIIRLQRSGQLYFGGHEGFVSDTVGSLVRCSLYSGSSTATTETVLSTILSCLFAGLLLLSLSLCFLRREVPLCTLFSLILASAVTLPILQHHLVSALFPIERAALYYLPLYAVTLLFAFDSLGRLSRHHWQKLMILLLPVAMAAVLTWHFFLCFTLHGCYWASGRHDPEVLELVNQDRELTFPGRTVRIGNSWLMEPSLNFYRITRHYTWLAPVTRAPISGADDDYIYTFEGEVKDAAIGRFTRLASYPDTQTVLLRIDRVQGGGP